jgi:hypothetical protein
MRSGVVFFALWGSMVAGCSGGVASDASPSPAPDPHLGVPAEPPARPRVNPAGDGTRWYALRRVSLGVTPTDDAHSSATAWRAIGYDLDGLITTAEDSRLNTQTCLRRDDAPAGFLADGDEGIDNAFGAHVTPTLRALRGDVEDEANASLDDGTATLLLRLDDVGGDDDAHVPGALFVARDFPSANGGARPRFDGNDRWPVVAASLVDGASLDAPKLAFPGGYVRGGVWVSGDGVTAVDGAVSIDLGFARLDVPMRAMLVTMRLDGGSGVLTGATPVDGFSSSIADALEAVGMCPSDGMYRSIVTTFTQAADLSLGAPGMQSTTKVCDALSLGLAFEATPSGAPAYVVADAPKGASRCASP